MSILFTLEQHFFNPLHTSPAQTKSSSDCTLKHLKPSIKSSGSHGCPPHHFTIPSPATHSTQFNYTISVKVTKLVLPCMQGLVATLGEGRIQLSIRTAPRPGLHD